jgi:hypothetical protein
MPEVGAIRFAGYDLPEVLHEEGEVLLLRGSRQADGLPVLAWLLPEEAPARRLVELLQREQAVLQHLAEQDEPRATPRPLGLERDGPCVALMLADPGGVALEQLLGAQALPIDLAIDLALAIVGALARVHAAGVLHRDLRPAHVLVDLIRGDAALVGFAAALIADEGPAAELPPAAAAYLSPEMTGRTGRSCDHRSDYYSLGAILYRMLTGRPPFDESDPLRLVHAHIVRLPAPPDALRPAIPRGLARVVVKLLAKTPEARYQSAHGLKTDLLRCREASLRGAALDFEPGQEDRSERLLVPDALLGRGEHVADLLAVFDACASGAACLALLLGPSGIGKSAVLRELQAPLARRGGQVAAGACRRLDQATPYAALAHGVQALFRQALAESGAPLQAWRELLHAALAGEGRLLLDVLPELELVLGPQPPVPRAAAGRARQPVSSGVSPAAAGPRPPAAPARRRARGPAVVRPGDARAARRHPLRQRHAPRAGARERARRAARGRPRSPPPSPASPPAASPSTASRSARCGATRSPPGSPPPCSPVSRTSPASSTSSSPAPPATRS